MDIQKGSLSQIPIIKLLIDIYETNASGVLYLKKEELGGVLKVLYFSRGKFYAAISNSDVDRLEFILMARKLLDEEAINRVNEEESISESKGKILVEKGLITLEQLIDCTKEQFKNIVKSVLKWDEGRFQYVEESPPDNLLNLDINILNFIFNYITQALDADYIRGHIGSMDMKLVKNQDTEKLNKYHLNEKQKVLLDRFNGDNPIDAILNSYPEEHRDSILKIIYFFFLSELIVKGRATADKPIEFNDKQEHQVYLDEKEIPKKDAFVFGKKSNAVSEEVPPKAPAPFYIPEKRSGDRKKSKQFSYIIVFIILIFILGGLVFILLMDEESPVKKTSAGIGEEVQTVSEPETKSAKEKKPPIVVPMEKQTGTTNDPESEVEKTAAEKSDSEKAPGDLDGKKTEVVEEKPGDPDSPPLKTALELFKEGDFYRACDAWKKEIRNSGISHSILLELDCQKESVLNAYNRIDRKDQFFILKRDMGNRICYLVFWGRFNSGEEATNSLNRVDPYFWGQSSPPRVMSLAQYL
jgi:hypothetical protein